MAPTLLRGHSWHRRRGATRSGDPTVKRNDGASLSYQLLISIIDDDRPFRESMRRLMKSLGYTSAVFPSAADFLASSGLTETSCLIADVHMPAMTGLELHRHLIQTGHPIPTILVTAYPSDVDRARALNDGVVCYLPKPLDEQSLSQCVRAALMSAKTP
jgi:FixJ family two-component response regulator